VSRRIPTSHKTNHQIQESQESEENNKVETTKETKTIGVAREIINEEVEFKNKSTEVSRRVGEGESKVMQQIKSKALRYRCQLLKYQFNSVSQTKLKSYSKADSRRKNQQKQKS
jgi:hypothetical protein